MASTKEYNYTVSGQWSGTWSATTDSSSWLTASLNNNKLSVVAQDNPNYTSRSGHVYVKYNNTTCKTIDVDQAAKSCDCAAINPITALISSISTDNGLQANTEIISFNNTNPCGSIGGKVYKNLVEESDLSVVGNKLILTNAIPPNETLDDISYKFTVTYGGVECTSFTFTQAAMSCSCPTIASSTTYNLPYEGVDNDTWFLAKTLYVNSSSNYNVGCIRYLSVVPYPHQGQIFQNSVFKVEYGGTYNNFYKIDVYVKNVPASSLNTSREDGCNLVFQNNVCNTFGLVQDGPDCACSSFGAIDSVISTIPSSGLSAGEEIAYWTTTPENCDVTALTATLSGNGTSQVLTQDDANNIFVLTNSIPANQTENEITYNLVVTFDDSNECFSTDIAQEPKACSCPPTGSGGIHIWSDYGIPAEPESNTWYSATTFSINAENLDSDCISSVTVSCPSYGGQFITDIKLEYNGTMHPAPGVILYRFTVLIQTSSQHVNQSLYRRTFGVYSINVNGSLCIYNAVYQDGIVNCDCESMFSVTHPMVTIENPVIPRSGTGENYVVFAKGNNYGCGTISAETQSFVEDFTVSTTSTTIDSGVTDSGVTVTLYEWSGRVPAYYDQESRTANINFGFVDKMGQFQPCAGSTLQIIQTDNLCSCPNIDIDGYDDITITLPDGEAHIYDRFDSSHNYGVVPLGSCCSTSLGPVVGVLTKLRDSSSNEYLCQYIMTSASTPSWCTGYTQYSEVSNRSNFHVGVTRNNTASARTCDLLVFKMITTTTNLHTTSYYSLSGSGIGSNYIVCGKPIIVHIVQPAAIDCTCENLTLSLEKQNETTYQWETITYDDENSPIEVDGNGTSITYVALRYTLNCGSMASYEATYVDGTPVLYNEVSLSFDSGSLIYILVKGNSTGAIRAFKIKLRIRTPNGTYCDHYIYIKQNPCDCSTTLYGGYQYDVRFESSSSSKDINIVLPCYKSDLIYSIDTNGCTWITVTNQRVEESYGTYYYSFTLTADANTSEYIRTCNLKLKAETNGGTLCGEITFDASQYAGTSSCKTCYSKLYLYRYQSSMTWDTLGPVDFLRLSCCESTHTFEIELDNSSNPNLHAWLDGDYVLVSADTQNNSGTNRQLCITLRVKDSNGNYMTDDTTGQICSTQQCFTQHYQAPCDCDQYPYSKAKVSLSGGTSEGTAIPLLWSDTRSGSGLCIATADTTSLLGLDCLEFFCQNDNAQYDVIFNSSTGEIFIKGNQDLTIPSYTFDFLVKVRRSDTMVTCAENVIAPFDVKFTAYS